MASPTYVCFELPQNLIASTNTHTQYTYPVLPPVLAAVVFVAGHAEGDRETEWSRGEDHSCEVSPASTARRKH